MFIAACLDVANNDSPSMTAAREHFHHWAAAEPALGVVDDLLDLPAWTLQATAEQKNAALTALATIGKTDSLAVTALAWLLLPAAARITYSLFDADPCINEIVASHLWSSCATHDPTRPVNVATSIIRRTRNGVLAEVGIGDRNAERRRDHAWAQSINTDPDDPIWDWLAGINPAEETPAAEMLSDLFDAAEVAGVITRYDRECLLASAREADRQAESGTLCSRAMRGRGAAAGLTTASVAAAVGEARGIGASAMSARVYRRLNRLSDFAKRSSDAMQMNGTSRALSG